MKKVLVVDDSTTVRNVLKTSLFEKYEVLEAENGKMALDVASSNNIDLFILDVNMPVMDGITLVKELRHTSDYIKTPIIMLTTESRDEKKQEGKAAGATGWVVKPVEPDKLLNILSKLI